SPIPTRLCLPHISVQPTPGCPVAGEEMVAPPRVAALFPTTPTLLSQTNVLGTPNLLSIHSRNASCTRAVVALLNGTSFTHLAKASWNTNKIVFPRLERGKGPTKSAHKTANAPPPAW
ncbi:hypothetical protein AWZ03_015185, partial [Drosophila navojoa]